MTNYKYIIKQFNPELLSELIVEVERLNINNCPENCFAREDCKQEGDCINELTKWFRKTRDLK